MQSISPIINLFLLICLSGIIYIMIGVFICLKLITGYYNKKAEKLKVNCNLHLECQALCCYSKESLRVLYGVVFLANLPK